MFVKIAFLVVLGLAFEKVYADEPESVVGGTNAELGEFPYQISLRYYGMHICGGSIVDDRHIVTAAHCVDDLAPPFKNLKVVTGSHLLNQGGETHNVKSIKVHPAYMSGREFAWANDAAVITLEKPMLFNAYQAPIRLATADPPEKASLYLTGWGLLKANGETPNQLQKATVYYINNEECRMAHRTMPIAHTHLCAIHSRGIGACQGDSGGPLVYRGQLVGIVSWVRPCAMGVPDAYTRVSQYDSFFALALSD